MELKEFKNYTKNLDAYTAKEVEEMEPMTKEELESYQHELEYDGGNLSNWDHLRVLITLKRQVLNLRLETCPICDEREKDVDW